LDRITGLQDLQDKLCLAKLGVKNGQDYKIYRINCVGLNWGLKMDRITGLQDLQDKLCWAKLGVKYGQDGRITRFTG
jgi:hypothetical protein